MKHTRILFLALLGLILWSGVAFAQTDTPTVTPTVTNTPTPTNTPTQTIAVHDAATSFRAMTYGTLTVDPPEIATISRGFVDVSIPGLNPQDLIICYPPADLVTTLAFAGCTPITPNVLRIYLVNPTAGNVDGASNANWGYVWWDRTPTGS